MNTNVLIDINVDWLYFFSNNKVSDYSDVQIDEAVWIPIDLSDWTVSSNVNSGADWFRRHIQLEPLEGCVRYVLKIERVPEAVTLFVNGKELSQIRGKESYSGDVTNFVALGNNVIAMKLTCTNNEAGGGFGKISLTAIPCV